MTSSIHRYYSAFASSGYYMAFAGSQYYLASIGSRYSKAFVGYYLHSKGRRPLPLLPGIIKPSQASGILKPPQAACSLASQFARASVRRYYQAFASCSSASLAIREGFRSLQILSSLRKLLVHWPRSPRGLSFTSIIKPPQVARPLASRIARASVYFPSLLRSSKEQRLNKG
jgi:hypothetical protein